MRGPRDSHVIKREFARRLEAAMIEKGWNQSELARRANAFLAKPAKGQKRGLAIGRDSVSHYMRGKMLPLPAYLEALAKALGKTAADLMPTGGFAVPPTNAPFVIEGLPDGRVSLRVNHIVSAETGMKIAALLTAEGQ